MIGRFLLLSTLQYLQLPQLCQVFVSFYDRRIPTKNNNNNHDEGQQFQNLTDNNSGFFFFFFFCDVDANVRVLVSRRR